MVKLWQMVKKAELDQLGKTLEDFFFDVTDQQRGVVLTETELAAAANSQQMSEPNQQSEK